MVKNNKNSPLRWSALISLLVNIAFNYYSNAYPFTGKTVGEISDEIATLFTPAGYAFSIWGLIYLSLVIYAIYQLLPSERSKSIYDKLAPPFIAINILSIGWIILFTYEYLFISSLVIAGMLFCAILLFGWSKKWILSNHKTAWLSIPFGLYAGWLSVATIANISIFLASIGWRGQGLGETTWTIMILVVGLLIGLIVSYLFRDVVFPMVISWAFLAIYVARNNEVQSVAWVALLLSIAAFLWSIIFAFRFYKFTGEKTSNKV